ncbi:MAG: iron ABC transporter permease [Bacteroidota bacterium]
MVKRNQGGLWKLAIVLMGVFAIVLSLKTGSFPIPLSEIWQGLLGQSIEHRDILFAYRMPRVLVALASGAVLSLSGFYMQVLIRNPLADPYIMGVTAGAGLGVNLLILGIISVPFVSIFTRPLFAGIGALGSLLLILALGFRTLLYDTYKLLIAGIAVSSICTALIGLLIYLFADSDQLRSIVFWTFGNLNSIQIWGWDAVYIGIAMWAISLGFGLRYGLHLDVMATGELQAGQLGMNIIRMKFFLLLVSTLSVGALVAFTGPIGFVGMMIPHISRGILGPKHHQNLFWGSLTGAVFLTLCDAVSRIIYHPTGIPIGIVTALVGIPFFLYLLFSDSKFLS